MKNTFQYGIIAFLLLAVSSAAMARNTEVKHLMGVSAEVGEWSLLPQGSSLNSSLGGVGSVGFVYDLQAGHFLFDLGVSITGGQTVFNVPDWSHTFADQTDSEGDMFDYVCSVSNRRDAYSNMAVKVPLLLGGQWGRFYVLAGVKFGFNALTQVNMSADLSAYGQYFQYVNGQKVYMFDRFFDEPPYTDEFFANRKMTGSEKTSFNVNLDASVEIGARLGFMTNHTGFDVPKSKVQYRLAVFADYGVLDIHKAQTSNAVDVISQNVGGSEEALRMHNILSTENVASAVNNLLVGIKFTVLFELPQTKGCVICRDGYNGFLSNDRKGRR